MHADSYKFEAFRELQEKFFVLPACWDVFSAALLQGAGCKAIATSSVSLGFANGFPATRMISKEQMLKEVSQIAASVDIPMSVDMESGYADTPEGVEHNVREIIRAGVVAFNIEDSLGIPGKALLDADKHAAKIAACRRAAEKEGVPRLFVNGRTDGFWIHDGLDPDEKASEAISRGNLYIEAGADGVFVSSHQKLSLELIRRLVREIKGPVSLLLDSAECTLADLKAVGVRRVTLGSLPIRAQAGFLKRGIGLLVNELDASLFREQAIPTPEINRDLAKADTYNMSLQA